MMDARSYRQPPHACSTVSELLDAATAHLRDSSRTPRLDAEVLLAHTLRTTRTRLLTWSDAHVTQEQDRDFRALLGRRREREPVAYLTGQREFYDLTLNVTSDVLIPRAETEILVNEALAWLANRKIARVLDVGTGSGCIALAIARHAPHCEVVASDISAAAIAVAQGNAERHQAANIDWRFGDLLSVVQEGERFDLILSNPPYVSPQEYESLEPNVREFEPRLALVAQEDGLAILHRLGEQARHVLALDGALGVEIGSTQGEAVLHIMQSNGFRTTRVVKDLAGNSRVVWGQ